MNVLGPLGVLSGQQQVVRLHDAVDALVVHRRQPRGSELPVQHRGDPAIAVGRTHRDQRRDQRHRRRVLRFMVAPTRLGASLQPVDQVRAGHPPRVSATTFTGNRPSAATARARSVF